MPKRRRLQTATQDQILLALYALAKVKVEELVPGCYREEVVHELAAVWLERLRTGGWNLPREDWEDFVVGEIRKRRVEDYRGRKRTLARDAIHLRIITDAPREWMSQDLRLEEERLRGFTDTVRGTLPAKCVKAHAMIRDDKLTYAEVAKKLHVSERCVHEYVKTVHRTFRSALPSVGIEAPKSKHGGRRTATADVIESTRRGFESNADVNTSTRDDLESTTAVPASTRGDFVSTIQVNPSARGDGELTRRDLESTSGDFESTRRDPESTSGDLESTRQDLESTRGDLESTRRDLELIRGDFEPTRCDFESSGRDRESTPDVNVSTRDDDALTRTPCSAPAPVRDSTRAESQTPSTLRDGTRTVSDATGTAFLMTGVV